MNMSRQDSHGLCQQMLIKHQLPCCCQQMCNNQPPVCGTLFNNINVKNNQQKMCWKFTKELMIKQAAQVSCPESFSELGVCFIVVGKFFVFMKFRGPVHCSSTWLKSRWFCGKFQLCLIQFMDISQFSFVRNPDLPQFKKHGTIQKPAARMSGRQIALWLKRNTMRFCILLPSLELSGHRWVVCFRNLSSKQNEIYNRKGFSWKVEI